MIGDELARDSDALVAKQSAPRPRVEGEDVGPKVCGECGLSHPCSCFTDAERGAGRVEGEATPERWVDEVLDHTRGCAYPGSGGEGPCTCGLIERRALATEQAMHSAWRKRAGEAEAEVARLTAEVERLTKEKAALRRMIEEDWTEGWWEDAPGWEDKMREAIERELALHLAALALPTPAPMEAKE